MRGFTLLETVIYIGLFALIMEGMFASVFAIVESADRNETKAYLEEEGDFIADKISYEISQSTSADSENDGEIDLISADTPEAIYLSNGEFSISRDGSAPVSFSSNLVQVVQSEFSVEPKLVSFSFTVDTREESGAILSAVFSRTAYFHP